MCREEAQKYAKEKPRLDKLGIRMAAVVKEDIGEEIKDFREYWNSDIYLDGEKEFYKAVGGGKLVSHSTASFLAKYANPWSTVNKNLKRSKASGIAKFNLKGEGLITGGLFVVHKKTGKSAFAFSESEIGDHANMEKVMNACKVVAEASEEDSCPVSAATPADKEDGKL